MTPKNERPATPSAWARAAAWLAGAFSKAPPGHRPSGFQLRPNYGQGPYTSYFNHFIARKVEPVFHEFLRESIPVIDAAINRLVSLDGHIKVQGESDRLEREIREWSDQVIVNDVQRGLQAFHQSISNEAFEQGFGVGEFVASRARNDIVSLRTADSKFIRFRRKRTGDGLEILQKSDDDRDWRVLTPDNLVYFSVHNENQNPYGTPLMRSCEFVCKCLVTIQNATLNVWERFGDPSFHIIYKTSKRDGADHAARRRQIEDEFNTAVRAKREGRSADFIRAIDKDSEIKIEVIGHDNQIIEMEVPARHVLEQIIAKTGLPSWMLGMHWSTTERLSNAEAEMVLADVATRQAAKLPLFTRLVSTMLQMRGVRYKPGDWEVSFENVHLHDVVAQAQARFLNAQADMYYLQNAERAGIEISRDDLSIGKMSGSPAIRSSPPRAGHDCEDKACGCKELYRAVGWQSIDAIELAYEGDLKDRWGDLLIRVKADLGIDLPKAAKNLPGEASFELDPEARARVTRSMADWIKDFNPSNDASPVNWHYGQATSAGYVMGASMIGKDQPLLNLVKNREVFQTLCGRGFDLVKNTATRAIIDKVLPEMEAFSLSGANPIETGRHLERLFGDANADWERLARSEMTLAGERAKKDEWQAWGETHARYMPAPGACPLCVSLGGEYPLDDVPLPVEDTHPRCRCGIQPMEEAESDPQAD